MARAEMPAWLEEDLPGGASRHRWGVCDRRGTNDSAVSKHAAAKRCTPPERRPRNGGIQISGLKIVYRGLKKGTQRLR